MVCGDGKRSGKSGLGFYRFGFQGQEKDDEIKGDGNSISFLYRVHDPRLGRFLSIDPLTMRFPWNSPYSFSMNRVIDKIELEGAQIAETATAETITKTAPVLKQSGPEFAEEVLKKAAKSAAKKSLFRRVVSWIAGAPTMIASLMFTPMSSGDPDPSLYYQSENDANHSNEDSYPTMNDNENEQAYVYRAMASVHGYPEVHPNPEATEDDIVSRQLGVRRSDIKKLLMNEGSNMLRPGHRRGGMSANSSPTASYVEHIQDQLKTGKRIIFKIKISDLVKHGLIIDYDGDVNVDYPTHVSIQPAYPMTKRHFQKAIRRTKKLWTPVKN